MHIKKGDKVVVIAGKEKGKSSTVVRALPTQNKVILEGLNIVKKAKKVARGQKATLVEVAMPIHASNVKHAEKKAKTEKVAKKKVAKKTVKKAAEADTKAE